MIRAGLCPLLTEEVTKKLRASGTKTVIDFISSNCEEISKRATIPYKDVVAIQRVLLAQYAAFPQSGDQLYEDVVSCAAIISTGCSSVDQLLDDGLYTSEVTEVVGGPGSGKTQFCLNCCVNISSETEQNVLYLDTGSGFDAERLAEMITTRNKSEKESEAILKRIKCQYVFTIFDLLTELERLKSILNQEVDPFYSSVKLVIVDCVASVISPVLGGHQTDGHGFMMHVARSLKSLAVDYSLAVLITNNLVQSDQPRAALGRSWASVPNTRLQIERVEEQSRKCVKAGETLGNRRKATLLKSTRQSIGTSVQFNITDKGLE